MSLPRIRLPGQRPLPARISIANQDFWRGLEQNEFKTSRCQSCQRLSFPPRSLCPDCYGREFDWVSLSGRGKLYACTTSHMAPPSYAALMPLNIAIIDLDEGLRLLLNLVDCSQPPGLDTPVELVVTEFDDVLSLAARPISHKE